MAAAALLNWTMLGGVLPEFAVQMVLAPSTATAKGALRVPPVAAVHPAPALQTVLPVVAVPLAIL